MADLADPDDLDGPHLVVVDDADRVDDVGGRLTAAVESGRPGLVVIAAGRAEALRSTYGHWTTAVRRSRLGFVMTASSELDGDLLGAALPRRCPIPPRPGLAWMIDAAGPTLVQIALDIPDAGSGEGETLAERGEDVLGPESE